MKKIYFNIKYYFLTFLNTIKIKRKLKNFPDWGKLLRSKFEKRV